MDAIFILRGFFLLVAATILFAYFISPIRRRFFQYGPRVSDTVAAALEKRKNERPDISKKNITVSNPAAAILDHLASYTVPHRWFIHFYALSVILSTFWAYQIWKLGFLFRFVAANTSIGPNDSMSTDKTALVWALMLIQGVRRLFECVVFAKRSSSKMWVGHWILGLAFYTCMSVAVWVEGSPALLTDPHPSFNLATYGKLIGKNILPTCLFFFSTSTQYRAHRHLASLPSAPNYALPTSVEFNRMFAPHYFAECIIYLALALLAAPEGQIINKTIASGLVFEVINLGITANETYKWYEQRFGVEKVKGRARMIPGVW